MTGSIARRRISRLVLPGLIGLALLSSACTGEGTVSGGGGDQTTRVPVHELASITTLQEAFNDDAGATRLILLLSPT